MIQCGIAAENYFNCWKSKLVLFLVVTVSEVEALYELFKKLSSSIIDDGLIHKVCSLGLHLNLFFCSSLVVFNLHVCLRFSCLSAFVLCLYTGYLISLFQSFRKNYNLRFSGTEIRRISLQIGYAWLFNIPRLTWIRDVCQFMGIGFICLSYI